MSWAAPLAPIAALALLAACTPPVAAPPVAAAPRLPDPVRGLDIADRNCSLCHALAAGGRSRDPRAPTFAALGAGYPMDALRAGLTAGEIIGHKGMPQIELAPAQIDDLIAYLRSVAAPR